MAELSSWETLPIAGVVQPAGAPRTRTGSWRTGERPAADLSLCVDCLLCWLTDLPIAFWDERLSTAAVERQLIEADVSRNKRAAVIDQHAAAFILQGALDRLARI